MVDKLKERLEGDQEDGKRKVIKKMRCGLKNHNRFIKQAAWTYILLDYITRIISKIDE